MAARPPSSPPTPSSLVPTTRATSWSGTRAPAPALRPAMASAPPSGRGTGGAGGCTRRLRSAGTRAPTAGSPGTRGTRKGTSGETWSVGRCRAGCMITP
eukprot:2905755-Rhodomonas_salina.3